MGPIAYIVAYIRNHVDLTSFSTIHHYFIYDKQKYLHYLSLVCLINGKIVIKYNGNNIFIAEKYDQHLLL